MDSLEALHAHLLAAGLIEADIDAEVLGAHLARLLADHHIAVILVSYADELGDRTISSHHHGGTSVAWAKPAALEGAVGRHAADAARRGDDAARRAATRAREQSARARARRG